QASPLRAQTQDIQGQLSPSLEGKSLLVWLVELKDLDPSVRANAAFNLAAAPEELRGVVAPWLLSALHDKDWDVRASAAIALQGMPEAAVQPLIGKLRHADAEVRMLAAQTLGYMDPDPARAALVPLTMRLRDTSPKVRAAAARALGT